MTKFSESNFNALADELKDSVIEQVSKEIAMKIKALRYLTNNDVNDTEVEIPFPYLKFTAQEPNSTVSLNKSGSPSGITLQYRVNGGEWEDYTIGEAINLTYVDDSVEFYGDNGHFSNGSSKYYKFVMTGNVSSTGSIMSLIGFSDSCTDSCFYNLFSGCTSLTTAPELPATTLADYCYRCMFDSCTSLVTAPELPATTLATCCYDNMFYGCTSLMVYNSSGDGHTNVWRIPTNGNATGSTFNTNVFISTIGDYSSTTSINFSTQQTFYTQNAPV